MHIWRPNHGRATSHSGCGAPRRPTELSATARCRATTDPEYDGFKYADLPVSASRIFHRFGRPPHRHGGRAHRHRHTSAMSLPSANIWPGCVGFRSNCSGPSAGPFDRQPHHWGHHSRIPGWLAAAASSHPRGIWFDVTPFIGRLHGKRAVSRAHDEAAGLAPAPPPRRCRSARDPEMRRRTRTASPARADEVSSVARL